MLESKGFKPFGEHIPRYPSEGNMPAEDSSMLPTLETTVLDDVDGLREITLLRNYLDAPAPHLRRETVRAIVDYVLVDYPKRYATMSVRIADQMDARATDPNRQSQYEAVQEELRSELEPSQFFDISFRFQYHAINNPRNFYRTKEALKSLLRNTFSKDEHNIFFVEEENPRITPELFRSAYKKYGSLMIAQFYVFERLRNRKPTQNEIDEFVQSYDKQPFIAAQNGQVRYNIAVGMAVDELVSEGYNIDVETERTPSTSSIASLADVSYDTTTFEGFRAYVFSFAKKIRSRNKSIATQVVDLETTARQTSTKTNVYVLLGVGHTPILEDLHPRVRSKAVVSVEERGQSDSEKLIDYLTRGEEPPLDLWEDAYRENNRLSRGKGLVDKVIGLLGS